MFKDESFSFQTEIALGAAYRRAADVATVERVHNGRARSWVDNRPAAADRLAAEATAGAETPR